MKNISQTIFVLIVIILIIILYQLSKSEITISPLPTPTSTSTVATSTATSTPVGTTTVATSTVVVSITPQLNNVCAFTVYYPKPNAAVTFPLEVRGVIDNSGNPDCQWTTFAGQAGDAQLYYDNAGLSWDPIGPAATIKAEKFNEAVTPFSVTLNYTNKGVGMKSGTKFLIRFNEENPKGGQAVKMLDLPVVLK